MSLDLLVDSDIAIKLCTYRMRIWESGQALAKRSLATLGVSKFVIPKRLKKCRLQGERSSVSDTWTSLTNALEFLEPTRAEIELAARFEASAQRASVAFDTGESQLVAIMAVRGASLFMSGDKRAICALAILLPHHKELSTVVGNVACAEQLFLELLGVIDGMAIRHSICGEAQADNALSICFQCKSADAKREQFLEGLQSYVQHLRKSADGVLCADGQILSRAA